MRALFDVTRFVLVLMALWLNGARSNAQNLHAELKPYIVPLVKLDEKRIDGSFFSKYFEGKSLVGLGEATHGTKEFFDIKSDIILALVETGKLKTVLFETEYGGIVQLNEFLHDSKRTDTEEAFRRSGIYDVYRCQEVLSLFERLKSYNLNQPSDEQVSVFGIDMQYTFMTARRIKQLLSEEGRLGNEHLRTLSAIDSLTWNHFYERNKIKWDKKANLELIAELKKIADSGTEWELGFCAQLLEQSLNMFYSGARKSRVLRDRFMADNIIWLQNKLAIGEISAVWAHNAHVTYADYAGHRCMGGYLKDSLGENYYALAFAFDHGEVSMVNHEVVNYPAVDNHNAVEYHLKSIDPRDFFLNFSQLKKNNALSDQLAKIKYMRVVGALPMPSKSGLNTFRWFEGFDGTIFLHASNASVKLNAK